MDERIYVVAWCVFGSVCVSQWVRYRKLVHDHLATRHSEVFQRNIQRKFDKYNALQSFMMLFRERQLMDPELNTICWKARIALIGFLSCFPLGIWLASSS